ncbi:DUF5959 family protein [Streptomyces sp. NPDC005146]
MVFACFLLDWSDSTPRTSLDLDRLLDAIEEAAQEADLDEPFTADWPQSGRTAYLRFIAEDPYVVEVHDGTSTQIVVSVPLDTGEKWIAESRERLAAARAALPLRPLP